MNSLSLDFPFLSVISQLLYIQFHNFDDSKARGIQSLCEMICLMQRNSDDENSNYEMNSMLKKSVPHWAIKHDHFSLG